MEGKHWRRGDTAAGWGGGTTQVRGGRVVKAGTKRAPDTAAHRLLTFAAVSGDVPTSDLVLILVHSRYREQVVTVLRRKHLLTTHSADGLCSYRLTMEGTRYLLAHLSNRCRPYLCPDRPNTSLNTAAVCATSMCVRATLIERAGVEIFETVSLLYFYLGASPFRTALAGGSWA